MSTYMNETMSNAPSTVVQIMLVLGFPNIYHAFRVLDNF